MRVWLYVIFTTYGCPPLSLNPVIRATRGVHLIVPVRVDVSLLNRGPLKCLPSCVPSSPQAASATRTSWSSPRLFDQWSASQSASSQFSQLLNIAHKFTTIYFKCGFECDAMNKLFLVPGFNNVECKNNFDWPQFKSVYWTSIYYRRFVGTNIQQLFRRRIAKRFMAVCVIRLHRVIVVEDSCDMWCVTINRPCSTSLIHTNSK